MTTKMSLVMLQESALVSGAVTGFYSRPVEYYVDAGAMLTNFSGATYSGYAFSERVADSYSFETGATRFAEFKLALPNNWNGGEIKSKFFWAAPSGSGSVVWGIQGSILGTGDSLNAAWGNTGISSGSFNTVSGLHVTPSTNFSLSGTVATDELAFFRVSRLPLHASDTFNNSSNLLGVKLQFLTSGDIQQW